MVTSLRISKKRITFWTLGVVGVFLILWGEPLVTYSTHNNVVMYSNDPNTLVYPYLTVGASLIILGFIMTLVAFLYRKITLLKGQIIMGLSGQALWGIVLFEIPLIPSAFDAPYKHSNSFFLGILGMALSLVSIILISSYETKPTPS
jgi:uncharacterized membrane protein YagU involved in acid resistance